MAAAAGFGAAAFVEDAVAARTTGAFVAVVALAAANVDVVVADLEAATVVVCGRRDDVNALVDFTSPLVNGFLAVVVVFFSTASGFVGLVTDRGRGVGEAAVLAAAGAATLGFVVAVEVVVAAAEVVALGRLIGAGFVGAAAVGAAAAVFFAFEAGDDVAAFFVAEPVVSKRAVAAVTAAVTAAPANTISGV